MAKQITKTSLLEALRIVAQAKDLTLDEFQGKWLADIYFAVLAASEAVEDIKKTVKPRLLQEDETDLDTWGIAFSDTYEYDGSKCPIIQKATLKSEQAHEALEKVMNSRQIKALRADVVKAQEALDKDPKLIEAKANVITADLDLKTYTDNVKIEGEKKRKGKPYDSAYELVEAVLVKRVPKRKK
jgi:hypothetical protein